ncbi:glycosyltransferase family 4 protein [Novosphingobium sp. ZW T3_23]|uniref:glycosyltransferase family 4 protein n=1 Tax=Novosphingobium sp. ZW T3_23 TaxID=3378084 RepID=UPI003854708E
MRKDLRIAFIGNALPRRCGIATFTTDLELAVSDLPEIAGSAILAMRDPGADYLWPANVARSIDQNDPAHYRAAADAINAAGYDVACLQHEFGIFGGEAGCLVLDLIAGLTMPLVTTLHTVLDRPSPAQRAVMEAILAASARVIVMAQKGRAILIETYGTDPGKIRVIPHGIPDEPFVTSDAARQRLGFAARQVILTFGLISPNKGIETMIEAMPAIVARCPDAVYVVMGATHPHLLRDAGETYRLSLMDRVEALGLGNHVVFLNRFAERPELLDHIAMCDVYVTPYPDEAQMTSGTLAYAHGLGRPVVSTPYWHATELLGDGTGVLVPLGDGVKMGSAVADLLVDGPARQAMATSAYAASRPMVWAQVAQRYVDAFREALRSPVSMRLRAEYPAPMAPPHLSLPATSNQHFKVMCDDTGLFQHAIRSIPDRRHGYCVDDNARALLLCIKPDNRLDAGFAWAAHFASFVQHAWNPDNRRFRNFMSFDRRWLEPAGSQDSHGRTLWALGVCTALPDPALNAWATDLFVEALPNVLEFTAPRSWAFALLGLDAYCPTRPHDSQAEAIRHCLAERLHALLRDTATGPWPWFESRLTYDNARLCEALILTGGRIGDADMLTAGLESLRWLLEMQTAPAGHFRPIGSHGFALAQRTPLPFDQQPLEACATVAACLAARQHDPDGLWSSAAHQAFTWFLGENDLAVSLVDVDSGSCRDGLHHDRANDNRGAESVLSYLLALADMRAMARYGASFPIPPEGPSDKVPLDG